MALQIRGSSQIKNASISLTKLDTQGGTIAGNVILSGDTITINNALSTKGTSTLGDSTSDTTTCSGTLNANAIENTPIGASTPSTGAFTTISSSGASTLNSLTVTNNTSVGGNLTVDGNLTVSGDTVQMDVSNLKVEDSLLQLSKNNLTDLIDIGVFGLYYPSLDPPIVTNGTFDDDIDDWDDLSTTNTGSYSVSWDSSTSRLKMNSSSNGDSAGDYKSMVGQDISHNFVSGEGYKLKVKLYRVSERQFLRFGLVVCDLDDTLTASPNEPISEYWNVNDVTSGSELTLNFTATSSHSSGLKIGIYLFDYGNSTGSVVGTVLVDDVKLTDSSDNEIKSFGGFYSGIFRDSTDDKFKLFKTKQQNITTTIDTNNQDYSTVTLKSNIEGDVTGNLTGNVTGNSSTASTLQTSRTISLGSDLSGSVSFDGSGDVILNATIVNNSIQYDDIDFLVDEDDLGGLSSSDVKIPSQQSVKKYVDDRVSDNGMTGLEIGDKKMFDSNNELVNVKNVIETLSISSLDIENGYVTISINVETQFEHLSSVFLNGIKLRFGTSTQVSNSQRDYYFDDTTKNKIYFSSDIITQNDKLEVRYYKNY